MVTVTSCWFSVQAVPSPSPAWSGGAGSSPGQTLESQLSRWDQYLDAAGNFKGIGIFMRNAVSAALVSCCGRGTGAGPSCAVIFKANQCLGHGVQ